MLHRSPTRPASVPAHSKALRLRPSLSRVSTAIALVSVALNPIACDCEPEPIDSIVCDFVVEPNNTPIAFPETAVNTERVRSFRIRNTGNRTLNAFEFSFDGTNAQHYRTEVVDVEDDLEISAEGDATISLIFEPLVLSNNLNARITVTHAAIGEIACPFAAIELSGSSFLRPIVDGGVEPDPDGGAEPEPDDGGVDPEDGGPTDGGGLEPDDGGELIDAGPVDFADSGVIIGPSSHWETRGALAEARAGFAAIELADGAILAIGGYGENGDVLDSIERFDPATGRSEIVGTMALPRGEPGAAQLADGRVVIAGGRTVLSSGFIATTIEIFTPPAAAGEDGVLVCPPPQEDCGLDDIDQGRGLMSVGRINPIVTAIGPAAVVVGFGRSVNLAGDEIPTAGLEQVVLTTPASASLVSGSDALVPRVDEMRHIASDGSFLLLGGRGVTPLGDIIRFSAGTGTIGPFGSLISARAFGAVTELLDGTLMIAGGITSNGSFLVSVERMEDPYGAGTVSVMADVNFPPRVSPTLVELPGEFILYASGTASAYHELEATESIVIERDADVFVPVGDNFIRLAPDNNLAVGRVGHHTFLVDGDEPNDTVLFLGGYAVVPRRIPHPHAERYILARNEFDVYGLMGDGAAVAVVGFPPAGAVVTVGGIDPHTGALSGGIRSYNLETDLFAVEPGLAQPRRDFSLTDLGDGNYLIAGGRDASGQALETAALFNPFSAVDAPLPVTLNRARANHTATVLDDGTVLLCGGEGASGEAIDNCEVFEPPTDLADPETWDTAAFDLVLGRLSRGRTDHTATLLATGEVLLTGGGDIEHEQTTADLFLPGPRQVRATGMPSRARRRHAAVHFGSGRVLIAGGEIFFGELASSASAEVYERTNEIFIPVDDMEFARVDPVALVTANGGVLIIGGSRPGNPTVPTRTVKDSDLYEPGITGIGEFAGNIDIPLRYGRAGHQTPAVDVGIVVSGTHRDGRLGTGVEQRSPLYFIETLVND